MLRVDKKAGFAAETSWFRRRYRFRAGRFTATQPITAEQHAGAEALQREQPVAVMSADGKQWWWFRDCFYWEDEELTPHDVMALVLDRERRRQRKLDRAHAARAAGEERRAPTGADPRRGQKGGLRSRRRPLRRVRRQLRHPVRPRHPVRDGRLVDSREPPDPLRRMQPGEG